MPGKAPQKAQKRGKDDAPASPSTIHYLFDPQTLSCVVSTAEKIGGGKNEIHLTCFDDGIGVRASYVGSMLMMEARLGALQLDDSNCRKLPSTICIDASLLALEARHDMERMLVFTFTEGEKPILRLAGQMDTFDDEREEGFIRSVVEAADVRRRAFTLIEPTEPVDEGMNISRVFSFTLPAKRLKQIVASASAPAAGADKQRIKILVSRDKSGVDSTLVMISNNGKSPPVDCFKWSSAEGGCSVRLEDQMKSTNMGDDDEFCRAIRCGKSVLCKTTAVPLKNLTAALSALNRGNVVLEFDDKTEHLVVRYAVDAETRSAMRVLVSAIIDRGGGVWPV